MSIATAIEGSPQCKSVEWQDESTKEQKLVSVICTLHEKDIDEYFNEQMKKYNEFKANAELYLKMHYTHIENMYKKHMTDNSPEFNPQKVTDLAQNICKLDETNYPRCDMEVFRREFNLNPDAGKLDDKELRQLFGNTDIEQKVCQVRAFGDGLVCVQKPVKPTSMANKVFFVINTDKTINVAKVSQLMNAQVTETYNIPNQGDQVNQSVLGDFYHR